MISHKTSQRIAIIGAGPAGLTLARLLQMQGYSPTVFFERETSPLKRLQGGSLDLHPDSGLRAVHLAGLDTQFRAIARYEDQGLRILDKQGTVLLEESEDARPEVDRTELRAMLLDSLTPGSIQWTSPVDRVYPTGDAAWYAPQKSVKQRPSRYAMGMRSHKRRPVCLLRSPNA